MSVTCLCGAGKHALWLVGPIFYLYLSCPAINLPQTQVLDGIKVGEKWAISGSQHLDFRFGLRFSTDESEFGDPALTSNFNQMLYLIKLHFHLNEHLATKSGHLFITGP